MAQAVGLYDAPMWEAIALRRMQLQRCASCATWRYPPGPVCPQCLASAHQWTEITGFGEITSWAVFHRQYLPGYPAPYNVVAVRLAEGPTMISNLEGPEPKGSWIGLRVQLVWAEISAGQFLPRFRLSAAQPEQAQRLPP